MSKPSVKPENPNFSSGPCAKMPGWSTDSLKSALVGRSHRSGVGKERLKAVIEKQREILGIPADYRVGIVPASDTGAIEMAMWSMLGERGVDVMAWENFSNDWLKDVVDHLKLDDARTFSAEYGEIVDLSQVDTDRDVIFAWNGTTSGVMVPNGDWIKSDRKGLTFCDATSGVFANDLPWDKLDVTTWSWQKVLGGEAAHGMLVLSPHAVERLENYVPDRPLPKIFRMTKKGKINEGLFKGETLNTPSMIAVEDCLNVLNWVESIGGLKETIARSQRSLEAIEAHVDASDWLAFLAEDKSVRSRTSVCLKVVDPWFQSLPEDDRLPFIKSMTKKLEQEAAAYDIASYRTAPAGLRIWCGATVETSDVEKLMPWLDWAYSEAKAEEQQKQAA